MEFEGEYLNGEKHGLCKEYYKNNKLRLEGEYIYGKRWNIKIYDPITNLTYELKKGKGYIKDFDNDGKLRFEGEYLNGERNGKAKEYEYRILIFEGKYLNGRRK